MVTSDVLNRIRSVDNKKKQKREKTKIMENIKNCETKR